MGDAPDWLGTPWFGFMDLQAELGAPLEYISTLLIRVSRTAVAKMIVILTVGNL